MQIMMLRGPGLASARRSELASEYRSCSDWGSWLLSCLPVLCFSATPFFGELTWRARCARAASGWTVPRRAHSASAVAFVTSTGAAFAPDGVFGHDVFFDSTAMFIACACSRVAPWSCGPAIAPRRRSRKWRRGCRARPCASGPTVRRPRVDVADIAVGDPPRCRTARPSSSMASSSRSWTNERTSRCFRRSRPVPQTPEGDPVIAGARTWAARWRCGPSASAPTPAPGDRRSRADACGTHRNAA